MASTVTAALDPSGLCTRRTTGMARPDPKAEEIAGKLLGGKGQGLQRTRKIWWVQMGFKCGVWGKGFWFDHF